MDVRDLRIGDLVTTKSETKPCRILELNGNGDVTLEYSEYKTNVYNILDIVGVKANKESLVNIGCVYDEKMVQYVYIIKGGLRIAIRPQMGTENYTASIIGQYRSAYCNFTYIHSFQHWLWEKFRAELT